MPKTTPEVGERLITMLVHKEKLYLASEKNVYRFDPTDNKFYKVKIEWSETVE